jgi:hypothetical protein
LKRGEGRGAQGSGARPSTVRGRNGPSTSQSAPSRCGAPPRARPPCRCTVPPHPYPHSVWGGQTRGFVRRCSGTARACCGAGSCRGACATPSGACSKSSTHAAGAPPHAPSGRQTGVDSCRPYEVRDAACPISTGGGTRHVHSVRGGGGAVGRPEADRCAAPPCGARSWPTRARAVGVLS